MRYFLPRPVVTSQQPPFCYPAVAKVEAIVSQERVGRCEPFSRQLRNRSEESVHSFEDEAGTQPRKTLQRSLEIREQPGGITPYSSCDAGDERLKLIGAEAIQKEMGNDKVLPSRRIPFENIGVDKRHRLRIQAKPLQSISSDLDHPGARVYTGDLSQGQPFAALEQKAAMAFAENQNITGIRDTIQKCRATALQLFTGEEEFHAAIMRRKDIETHAVRRRGSHW